MTPQAAAATIMAAAVLRKVSIQATVSATAARDSSASIGGASALGFCFLAATLHLSRELQAVGMDGHVAAAVEHDLKVIAAAP